LKYCVYLLRFMESKGPASSSTVVQVKEEISHSIENSDSKPLVLRLRERKFVAWDEEVVNNEKLGRRKSKSK